MVNPACIRKIKKEAIKVHIMSIEAACSDRALMGFPVSSPWYAPQAPLWRQRKRRRRRRK
jgi:hypothetical protein